MLAQFRRGAPPEAPAGDSRLECGHHLQATLPATTYVTQGGGGTRTREEVTTLDVTAVNVKLSPDEQSKDSKRDDG